MQEQVEEKSVALSIKATKITGRLLAQAMQAFLKKLQEPSFKHGKQSVKSLTKQGASLSSVPIDGDNIGSFNKNSHEPPLATVNETVGRWQYFE